MTDGLWTRLRLGAISRIHAAVCCSPNTWCEITHSPVMSLIYTSYHCTLRCIAVCCSVLQYVTVCCSVLQCVAVCCSMLQCVAVCYSVLQCVAVCCSVLQCVAVCSSVLQCVAVRCSVCCSVLQCVAVCVAVCVTHYYWAAHVTLIGASHVT